MMSVLNSKTEQPAGAPIIKTVTVLAKTYPGTGRPDSFQVVNDDDEEEIERLEEGYGYFVVDNGCDAGIDPWERYTYTDVDGFTQWRQEAI